MVRFLLNPELACPEFIEGVEGEVGVNISPPLTVQIPLGHGSI